MQSPAVKHGWIDTDPSSPVNQRANIKKSRSATSPGYLRTLIATMSQHRVAKHLRHVLT